jgi:hypothetical protein
MSTNFELSDAEWSLITPHLAPFGKQSRVTDRKAIAALLLAQAANISIEDAAEWTGVSVSALRSRKSRLGTGAYRAMLKAGEAAGKRLAAAYLDAADDSDTGRVMKILGYT